MRIECAVTINAAPARTWLALADIASHVSWMRDAQSLTFTTTQHVGLGTSFDCRTKVGPFTTTDRMTITEWEEPRHIGVAHTGIVSGTGRFELTPGTTGTSVVTWTEDLRFPTRLGGRVTTALARPILARLWRGNLRRLKVAIEAESV